jgi:hypothetical protein
MKSCGILRKNTGLPVTACFRCNKLYIPAAVPATRLSQRKLIRPMYAGRDQDSTEKSSADHSGEEDAEQRAAEERIEEAAVEESSGVR